MLSKQPKTQYCWHPFAIARPSQILMFTDESIATGIPGEKRQPYLEIIEQANIAWKEALENANAAVSKL